MQMANNQVAFALLTATTCMMQGRCADIAAVGLDSGTPSACLDDACLATAGHDSKASSLLQRAFQRQPESGAFEKDFSSGPCEGGVVAQGKCWRLSGLGESCSNTCAEYGEIFSFAVADNTKPITPSLLGESPHIRQSPWAALECFVKGEDRYHTANVKAAKHFVGDIGKWSHAQCQLACPCGDKRGLENECGWKQPPACAPVFEWKGVIHTGCTKFGHDKPWCMHHFHHTELDVMAESEWSECELICGADSGREPDEKRCEWNLGNGCSPEFDYEGTRYVGCTSADHASPWCSLSDKYAGRWTHCEYSCPFDSKLVEDVMLTVRGDDELCSWHPQPKCSNVTVYKGVTYTGCIDIDYPTPWCSHDSDHAGNWGTCRRSCNQVTLEAESPAPQAPEPQPQPKIAPTPAPTPRKDEDHSKDPCARSQDGEGDIVGNYVSLDESGYKALARVDSFENMKRFVCRVVDTVKCKVIDHSGLSEFVPHYSSVASHQTYEHLVEELTSLCHAGDKWLVPAWYA